MSVCDGYSLAVDMGGVSGLVGVVGMLQRGADTFEGRGPWGRHVRGAGAGGGAWGSTRDLIPGVQ